MAAKRIDNFFKNLRALVAGLTFNPQSADPGNSDGRPTMWCDSTTVKFKNPTIQCSNLNFAGMGDVSCVALHVDAANAAGGSPYLYDKPNDAWLFVDAKHPPTTPHMRFVDEVTDAYRLIVSSNGSTVNRLDPDQSISY